MVLFPPRPATAFRRKLRSSTTRKIRVGKKRSWILEPRWTLARWCPFGPIRQLAQNSAKRRRITVLREREGEGWKETFKVGRMMCQKTITREQAIQLVTQGKTELIEKFTSKKGRPFDAFLVRQGGRITWEFPPRKPREGAAKNGKHAPRKAKPPVDLTNALKLSESKLHHGDLYQTEDSFVVAKPEPNGSPRVVFQLKRNLCGKEISAEDAERLVETGKTGLIEGFVSKRGSNFSAYLTLSKDKKKAEFEFPPR